MIKYISLDLQGTLSDSKFSDNFWIEIIPQKYAEKFNISIDRAKQILKEKFKEYGVYNILYYDDKYWSEFLNFDTKQELNKSHIRPSINKKLYEYLKQINLPKIIVSTTTDLFINYELKEKIKDFEKIYSCCDYFKIGGKTEDIFKKISKELNIKPEEILHIGDNLLMDVENAKKAGVNAILYDDNEEKLEYNIEKYLKSRKKEKLMEHEMIDEYNKIGQKIGVVDKEIAHRDGLWHKAIHVWIMNDKNEILLQYRCAEKKLYPNMWDTSFAGHIGAGESSIEAVIREGKEELGIDVNLENLEFLMTMVEKVRFREIVSNEFIDIYILRQNVDIEKIALQKEEVSDAKYVTIDKFFEIVDKGDICPHEMVYKVLRDVLK